MPSCRKCQAELPTNAVYCPACGTKQALPTRGVKRRGNSTGSVYRLPNKKWRAEITLAYVEADGKIRRIRKTKSTFTTKRDALEYLPQLKHEPARKRQQKKLTLRQVYDLWIPTHDAGKSTMGCYQAAFGHFVPIQYIPIEDIGIDDLQECVDDCPLGRQTKRNMRTISSLLYQYAIPRGLIPENINYAEYIKIHADAGETRDSLTDAEVELIRAAAFAPEPDLLAQYAYCMIYTGFRTHEFLTVEIGQYADDAITGGSKTEAGKDRTVTLSPKIAGLVRRIVGDRTSGVIFADTNGKPFTDKRFRAEFAAALKRAGVTREGVTPYYCRHTFATLMDRVDGSTKCKLELIGHTDERMTRHYQHPNLLDLRKITDMI